MSPRKSCWTGAITSPFVITSFISWHDNKTLFLNLDNCQVPHSLLISDHEKLFADVKMKWPDWFFSFAANRSLKWKLLFLQKLYVRWATSLFRYTWPCTFTPHLLGKLAFAGQYLAKHQLTALGTAVSVSGRKGSAWTPVVSKSQDAVLRVVLYELGSLDCAGLVVRVWAVLYFLLISDGRFTLI